MAAFPFALSVHHFISSVGADAGFAAIIGLAIMVLLFFSQARETASLRRRADEADEELSQLHAYVDRMARARASQSVVSPPPAVAAPPSAARAAPRPAAAPLVAPTPSRSMAPAVAGAGAGESVGTRAAPAAPAGVAAPALAAATRLIPLGADDAVEPQANGHAAGDPGAVAVADAPPVADPADAGDPADIADREPQLDPPGPLPSTAAAGANGHRAGASVADERAGDEMTPPRVALRPAGAPGRAVPPPPVRSGAASGRGAQPNGRSTARRRVSPLAIGLVAAAVVAAVVVVAVFVLGGSSSSGGSGTASSAAAAPATGAGTSGSDARHHHHQASTAAAPPSQVTVAVLNGTTTANLAHDVMAKLTPVGYRPGATTDASDQSLTSTIVGYAQPADRGDALAVARRLNLGVASVQAVSPGDLATACSTAPKPCPVRVVVSVGSDLAAGG